MAKPMIVALSNGEAVKADGLNGHRIYKNSKVVKYLEPGQDFTAISGKTVMKAKVTQLGFEITSVHTGK